MKEYLDDIIKFANSKYPNITIGIYLEDDYIRIDGDKYYLSHTNKVLTVYGKQYEKFSKDICVFISNLKRIHDIKEILYSNP